MARRQPQRPGVGIAVRRILTGGARVVEEHGRQAAVQPVEQGVLSEQRDRFAILQHVAQALGGVGWVEGDIGGAGLEDSQQGDDHLRAALDAEGDAVVGPDAERHQVMRQLIGAAVEFSVTQRPFAEDDGDGVGASLSLRFEQFMNQ
ncbi:hypothetical protein AU508_16220 [Lonsdalea populi]|nr:hypothetical protein AU508_16220 [Lonsdalea populi]